MMTFADIIQTHVFKKIRAPTGAKKFKTHVFKKIRAPTGAKKNFFEVREKKVCSCTKLSIMLGNQIATNVASLFIEIATKVQK